MAVLATRCRERGGALLALALLALVVAGAGCPGQPPARFVSASRGGVSLSRLSDQAFPRGPRVQASSGDYLLESERLRVVIADSAPHAEIGGLRDVTAGAWSADRLGVLMPLLEVGELFVALVPVGVSPDLSSERPRVVAVHEARGEGLRLVTTIELVPGEHRVRLTSELENVGHEARRVRLGDRLRWHGEAPFAPGVGYLEQDVTARVPWLARPAKDHSYALTFAEPAELRFRAGLARRDEQLLLGPARTLEPGARARRERSLIVAPGPLEAVAAAAWKVAGTRVGWVKGRLEPEPRWAVIDVLDASGRTLVSANAERGRFRAPVPPGAHSARLQVPGGSDEQKVRVSSGRESEVGFLVPRAAHLSFLVTDKVGAPLPVRLVLSGIAPTPNPKLGPYHSARGAENVVASASGRGDIELPPGRYTVVATHGPEHTLDEREVEVSAERGSALRMELEPAVDTSGWVACDFHLHAEPSGDSDVPLADRVTTLLAEGLDLAVATDHNHVTDYGPSVAALGAASRLAAVTGIEITTAEWGHFNAFPYPLEGPLPPFADTAPDALFPFVRATSPGAIVQVNHPRMGGRIGYFDLGKLDTATLTGRLGFTLEFDTLEVWNGFDLAKPDVLEAGFREWLELIARGRRVTAVGNSDSHRVVYEWAGYPRTYVRVADEAPGGLAERVAEGLRAGRAIVTSGPFIDLGVQGAGPGERVQPSAGEVEIELEVRAPPWIVVGGADIYVNGEITQRLELGSGDSSVTSTDRARLRWTGKLPVAKDAFIVARARTTSDLHRVLPGTRVPSGAFTNPVFVDADGDGRWSAPVALQTPIAPRP